jgi:hypothetical protein
VLIPILGMVGVARSSGMHRWSERRTAIAVNLETTRMDALLQARNAVVGESVASMAVAIATERDVSTDQLARVAGIDFRARLADARAEVDDNALIYSEFGLSAHLRHLLGVRPAVDAGRVASTDVSFRFEEMADAVNDLWLAARVRLDATIAAGSISGPVRQRVDVLRRTYDAFLAGDERVRLANEVASGSGGGTVRALIAVDGQLDAALTSFEGDLGDAGTVAFDAFRDDPAVIRFDAVVDDLIENGMSAQPSSLSDDAIAYGAAFADGARWMDAITDLVTATSADLGGVTAARVDAATSAFWRVVGGAWIALLVAMTAAALLTRSILRPLRRVAAIVEAVRAGDTNLPDIAVHGPRELADAADAINEMAAALDGARRLRATGGSAGQSIVRAR